MSIKYTVVEDDPRWMLHKDRHHSYETECDGCKVPFTSRFVQVLTDRSGSEYAVTHDDPECVGMAIVWIDEEDAE